MTLPPNPWFLRLLDGGNPKTYAIATVAFTVGYLLGKGDRNHWKDVARSGDKHWHDDHHGHYTQKEHDREHERHHRHGDSYER